MVRKVLVRYQLCCICGVDWILIGSCKVKVLSTCQCVQEEEMHILRAHWVQKCISFEN